MNKLMDREMNFWDLCVALSRALCRGCQWFWQVLLHMVRLTLRYWWLVITLVVLALGAAFYIARFENLTYKVNAVVMLNGATIPQFEQAFAPLRSGILLPDDAEISQYVHKRIAGGFSTYRVIDCKNDGTADMIDFKGSISPTDTLRVPMQDRLCLQFRVKVRDMRFVPHIEQALMDYLNSNIALQQAYPSYVEDLREEVAFHHRQAVKLDSLTSSYYFAAGQPAVSMQNGLNVTGERRIRLFLNEIYKQQEHTRQADYRIQLATAPVVLENHFAVDPKPSYSRRQCMMVFGLFAWVIGCAIAQLIEKRKAICAWLKK